MICHGLSKCYGSQILVYLLNPSFIKWFFIVLATMAIATKCSTYWCVAGKHCEVAGPPPPSSVLRNGNNLSRYADQMLIHQFHQFHDAMVVFPEASHQAATVWTPRMGSFSSEGRRRIGWEECWLFGSILDRFKGAGKLLLDGGRMIWGTNYNLQKRQPWWDLVWTGKGLWESF